MIAQRNQDTQDQVSESVSREQYEEMRRIANSMLFWVQKMNIEGRSALNDVRYLADMREVERLGLNGDR